MVVCKLRLWLLNNLHCYILVTTFWHDSWLLLSRSHKVNLCLYEGSSLNNLYIHQIMYLKLRIMFLISLKKIINDYLNKELQQNYNQCNPNLFWDLMLTHDSSKLRGVFKFNILVNDDRRIQECNNDNQHVVFDINDNENVRTKNFPFLFL